MAVFLLVLKIIGIVLLSVLALALLIILMVLFLPIHYKLKARLDKDERLFVANAKVTYLAYLVHAEADAHNNKFSYYLKILGRKFIESEEDTDDEDYREEEPGAFAAEALETEARKGVSGEEPSKAEAASNGGASGNRPESNTDVYAEIAVAPERAAAEIGAEVSGQEVTTEGVAALERETAARDTGALKQGASEDVADAGADGAEMSVKETGAEAAGAGADGAASDDASDGKRGFFSKVLSQIRSLLERIRSAYLRLVNAIKNIGYTISGVYDKIRAVCKKVEYYKELMELDSSQEAIAFGWRWLKYVLWHIRPRRLTGFLKLGREDPADTGEILGLVSALNPIYGGHFVMEPDFESEVLQGDFYMKGYIQLYVVAIAALRLYLNKNFMRFVRRVKRGQRVS